MSKVRVSQKGIKSGGRRFSRGALYELLANPIYIGEIRHKQERHPGQHEAILPRELWERVQQRLRENIAKRYVERLSRLAFAAPRIGEAIAQGLEPAELNAETLLNRIDLPLEWSAQLKAIGID